MLCRRVKNPPGNSLPLTDFPEGVHSGALDLISCPGEKPSGKKACFVLIFHFLNEVHLKCKSIPSQKQSNGQWSISHCVYLYTHVISKRETSSLSSNRMNVLSHKVQTSLLTQYQQNQGHCSRGSMKNLDNRDLFLPSHGSVLIVYFSQILQSNNWPPIHPCLWADQQICRTTDHKQIGPRGLKVDPRLCSFLFFYRKSWGWVECYDFKP